MPQSQQSNNSPRRILEKEGGLMPLDLSMGQSVFSIEASLFFPSQYASSEQETTQSQTESVSEIEQEFIQGGKIKFAYRRK
jgi:hypothetical protein